MKIPPRINDVATDLEDTPSIEGRREMRESFKAVIRARYPELRPLHTRLSPEDTYEVALDVAQGWPRWKITREDAAQGTFQGVATTAVFRFQDDFVVRVRKSDGGSRVDMRSKSRVGRGDIGANAARIQKYLRALGRRLEEDA